ncbi:MAG TPA: hypothetical protein VFU10_02390 [Gaiellaceae bacterium]|nr:hypothetical protein [Gaiellaceae bacterium]
MIFDVVDRRRAGRLAFLVIGILVVAGLMPAVARAVVSDSGTVNVQVADRTGAVVDATTNAGAFVSYFGDKSTSFGSSGTGIFDPFVRLQNTPTEAGYNTDGVTEFDTKVGTWTHAILVSHIPQRPCPQAAPTKTCFELFNDINENNSTAYVSLNKVEVYYTSSATLTGYPFGANAALQYAYSDSGGVLIHDVNQGSGRGDLRYDIPIGVGGVPLPPNCDFGNPSCTTYFVLYSKWGTSNLTAPDGTSYGSDGGFEEWKVKSYPAITLSKTPSPANVCNGSSTSVTYTYVVTNTGTLTVSGSVVDDNGTPGNTADDVAVGSFSNLAPGSSQTFTHTFTGISGTRTNVATATATAGDVSTTTTATATVTGHPCTISITKTANPTNVCNGSGTQVTYTYVVTNNSDFYNVSGTVTDNVYGTIGSFGPLAPGASATLTKTAAVNGTITNTATATGTFNDSKPTSASATASATVTGHTCTIALTKTPSVTNVCNGSGTQVTYTYVVTNTGDFFNVSGTVTDDVIGTIGSFGPLAPGASATLTKTAAVNGTITNTATANGTFNDSKPTSASATASATVTGHTCTIALTKTPNVSNVCNGGPVTYTYTVTNNSDLFTWTGSLTDDKLGTIAASITLTAGQSKTFTASGNVTGTVTNTATASGAFNDAASTTASATKQATVTGHVCTISLTKTPSATSVCNGDSVTYTYVVTNNSDLFTWTGSLTDDKLGTIAASITLTAGQSKTFTAPANITGTVVNTATASGAFDDPASTSASATASATVNGQACSHITPTNTTCSDFKSGTASTLSELDYTVKSGVINSVAPGVFFYWIGVQATAGSNTFTIHQAITTGNFDSHFFAVAAGSNVFNPDCTAASGVHITQNGADVTVTFSAGSAGTYFIGIKFDSTSVKGFATPSPTTVHYVFSTLDSSNTTLSGSTSGLDLVAK